ncbi:MAG: ATP-binding cassette domain-containing protein [Rhizobiales bacterium]|nr:ATP-binding cassette domain-containing protein [Hyphomicrobiales bacterium]
MSTSHEQRLAHDAGSAVIRARGLEKRYGDFQAVRGIDLTVARGQCVGLLGPNGAGKTTTMRMIMGLSKVTAGELTIFGKPVDGLGRADRAKIGLVPQEDNLDPDLRVRENLEVYGRYFKLPSAVIQERVPRLLDFMELGEKAGQSVMQLSGGMKRRLVIARALIGDPELVILDEPTTGLDPQARVLIWRQLQKLKREGKTLLLTTHYMDEAERLSDHIVIIDAGRILAEGSPKDLIRRHVRGHVFDVQKPLPGVLANGSGALERFECEDIGDSVLFYVEQAEELKEALTGQAIYLHRPANLEDVFLRLTGRKLRENA